MKETKYRAWDKRKNLMIQDVHKGTYNDDFHEFLHYDCYEVMQYIGLKDKNEIDIFADDYVEIRINRIDRGDAYTYAGLILWDAEDFCWSIESEKHGTEHLSWVTDGFTGEYFKIIGNKWQNPELLEVK